MSKDAEKLYRTWNVTVRNVYRLDRRTHRNLIEPLSNCLHLKGMLLSRFVSFHRELLKSRKFSVRFLARLQQNDLRTSAGRTSHSLLEECRIFGYDLEKLTPGRVKSCVRYAPVTSEWEVKLAKELLALRDRQLVVNGFGHDEVEEMFNYICTN